MAKAQLFLATPPFSFCSFSSPVCLCPAGYSFLMLPSPMPVKVPDCLPPLESVFRWAPDVSDVVSHLQRWHSHGSLSRRRNLPGSKSGSVIISESEAKQVPFEIRGAQQSETWRVAGIPDTTSREGTFCVNVMLELGIPNRKESGDPSHSPEDGHQDTGL